MIYASIINCSDKINGPGLAWPGRASNLFFWPSLRNRCRIFNLFVQDRKMLRNVSKGAVRKVVTELGQYPKPGEKLHGFTLLRSKHVPELELTALHLQHDKTGADYLHVAREDKNNVFSIGFKTNPPDDTGIPHILEHTTLCGSEK
jgi:hypothetical protein